MNPTYHIVSHSHWDREWYKTFEQFRSMLVTMVDDLLDLLDRDPKFVCFTLDGQTVILEDYLAIRPDRENDLRRHIEAGRLIVGPWYILPDEFLVSAEATVRNLLVGTRLAEKFGGKMDVGYIPDSFGHIAMMPAILKGFNIGSVLVYRGFGGEEGQNRSEYWWKAPDGTRSLMIHLYKNGYSAGYFHDEADEEIVARFAGLKAELDERATTSHRLLMNGGDHHWPDPKLPATLDLLRKNFDGTFVHSSVPAYVNAVTKEVNGIPEIAGELRFGYRYAFVVLGGVYSSRMYIKQENWNKQNMLQRYMEPLHALAHAAGMRSQHHLVQHAWKTLLKNHPHDSICGCSIDPVHREMMTRFKAVEDIAASVVDESLGHLVPTEGKMSKDDSVLCLFNPSPWGRTEAVPAEIKFFLQDVVVGLNPDVRIDPKRSPVKGFVLEDEDGKEVPYQILSRTEAHDIAYTKYNYPTQTIADAFSILVDAKDVPPLGFKQYNIRPAARRQTYASRLKCGRTFIENDYLRIDVNTKGELRVTDKFRNTEYAHLHVFEDSGDVGDEYNYSYPRKDKKILSTSFRSRVRLVERGPLRAALEIRTLMRVPASASPDRKSRSAKSVRLSLTTTVLLTQYSRYAEIMTTVDNTAKDHRLRALFPTGINTKTILADSQFCIVEREQKKYNLHEFTIEHPAPVAPMQRFVSVRDKRNAFTLFSYGLPEYELIPEDKGTIALTLLRCVGLLAAGDLITRPGGKSGWHNDTPEAQCQGQHTFRYAILPHGPEEMDTYAAINEASEQFQYPLLAVRRKANVTAKPAGISISSRQLLLSALKQAEDGEELILRMSNPVGQETDAIIHFGRGILHAWRANLNEETIERMDVHHEHDIPIHVRPFDIVTLKIEFTS